MRAPVSVNDEGVFLSGLLALIVGPDGSREPIANCVQKMVILTDDVSAIEALAVALPEQFQNSTGPGYDCLKGWSRLHLFRPGDTRPEACLSVVRTLGLALEELLIGVDPTRAEDVRTEVFGTDLPDLAPTPEKLEPTSGETAEASEETGLVTPGTTLRVMSVRDLSEAERRYLTHEVPGLMSAAVVNIQLAQQSRWWPLSRSTKQKLALSAVLVVGIPCGILVWWHRHDRRHRLRDY
ncbi:putative transmembrane protein [Gregarina niphandrodes]|uniref:Transmembrane protein n=1 Tax=Gregarina niphandrodes TaxID=110365 RepID=A0A023B047_GRENI|nr:putative transmembrane protein [Gregarina niphandrodes]EZG44864.1 putative transmembrane protein [Gregarina niphandrodes]|eukprot:XP_011132632.1 putative transmembrane protein [Gregarina niphandrodes]